MNILVVDDELSICELLDEFLSMLGHRVTIASSGEEALSLLDYGDAQVVLLDIRMPGVSGIEVLRKIRKNSLDTGVIMLSAFGDRETIQRAMDMGANYYMEKPIELEQLIKVLDGWQESRGMGAHGDS